MSQVQTFVFLDLETTGIKYGNELFHKIRITELSMVAVKREHFLDAARGETPATPQVQHKLTLCLNPLKPIDDGCTRTTGLDNFNLEHEPAFDQRVSAMIDNFLNVLTQPVCFVAHNGFNYDYYLLRNRLAWLQVDFSTAVLCADSFDAFYQILEQHVKNSTPQKRSFKSVNEPSRTLLRQTFPWGSKSNQPADSYKLSNVYRRVLGKEPENAHRAENDCLFILEMWSGGGDASVLGEQFVGWVDNNHVPFSDIEPVDFRV